MALSDCEKCWDTPCTCGYRWLHWDTKRLREMIKILQKIVDDREKT